MASSPSTCCRCGLQTRMLDPAACGHQFCSWCIAVAQATGKPLCSLHENTTPMVYMNAFANKSSSKEFQNIQAEDLTQTKVFKNQVTPDTKSFPLDLSIENVENKTCQVCHVNVETNSLNDHYKECSLQPNNVATPVQNCKSRQKRERQTGPLSINNLHRGKFTILTNEEEQTSTSGAGGSEDQIKIHLERLKQEHEQAILKLKDESTKLIEKRCSELTTTMNGKFEELKKDVQKEVLKQIMAKRKNEHVEDVDPALVTKVNNEVKTLNDGLEKCYKDISNYGETMLKFSSTQDGFQTSLLNQKNEIDHCKENVYLIEARLDSTTKSLSEWNEKYNELISMLATFQDDYINEKQRIKDWCTGIQELPEDTKTKIDKLQEKQNDYEFTLKLQNEEIAKMLLIQEDKILHCEARQTSRTSNLCTHSFRYIWKVENFYRLQRQARSGLSFSTHSDPFYGNPYGYKMRMVMYPNGTGDGAGNYLSFCLQLMKGPMDAILLWPLNYKITCILVYQTNQKNNFFCKGGGMFSKPASDVIDGWRAEHYFPLELLRPPFIVDSTIFVVVNMTIN